MLKMCEDSRVIYLINTSTIIAYVSTGKFQDHDACVGVNYEGSLLERPVGPKINGSICEIKQLNSEKFEPWLQDGRCRQIHYSLFIALASKCIH